MKHKMNKITIYLNSHISDVIAGFVVWLIAYFSEMQGATYVMAGAFFLDLFVGIINSVFKKKEKFEMNKVYSQFLRFAIILMIVMLLFAMDKEMKQDMVSVYNGVMWVVSGFLAYSIADNGFNITGWRLFDILKNFIKNKTEVITDINISE